MTTKAESETELINSTRCTLFSGPGATRLVATIAERKRSQERRIIAIGRSANGQPFRVVTAPADFALAVAEVDVRQGPDVRLSAAALEEIEGEHIGEDVSRHPFLY